VVPGEGTARVDLHGLEPDSLERMSVAGARFWIHELARDNVHVTSSASGSRHAHRPARKRELAVGNLSTKEHVRIVELSRLQTPDRFATRFP
jgi:hypothetical protein